MFDSSLPEGGEQHRKFIISSKGDIPCEEVGSNNAISIQFTSDKGWVLKLEKSKDLQVSWYVVPRSTNDIGHDYLDGHKILEEPNIQINGKAPEKQNYKV